jgi:hypothetical protein
MLISMLFVASILVVYSEAQNGKDEQLFQMKYRQVEKDDQSANSPGDSREELGIIRRQSSQCEPCGALRRPCCFPNLCQHRSPKISKCYQV